MDTNEHQWHSMKFNEHQVTPIDINKYQEHQWTSMDINGQQWTQTNNNEHQWETMDINEQAMDTNETQ